MKIIGVTGSSGSGKSTVSHILEKEYGAEIIDADKVAKELSKKGMPYLNAIVQHFGEEIVDEQGNLNRQKLAKIIYEEKIKREALDKLTFFYVVKEIKERVKQLEDCPIVVIDAPLLIESGLHQLCDTVIAVVAEEEIKIDRICRRDHITKEDAKKRLSAQHTDAFYMQSSDNVLWNQGGQEELEEQIRQILQ